MLTNKEYAESVNRGEFPEEVQVPLDPPFIDDRGTIQNIFLGTSGSTTFIESKKGAIRARHIHSLESGDFHGTYMISGSVIYTEKDEDGNIIHQKEYKENEMFMTRPGVWHEMLFTSDSKMITCNGIVKDHLNYERSIVRKNK